MIDKTYHMEKAKDFCHANDCYIHTEMRNGKMPETILCGDFHAIMWGIVAEINRIGEKIGADWHTTLGMINALRHYGYEEATRGIDKSDTPVIDGEDWQEQWKEAIRLEETKRANIEVANLKVDLKKAEKTISQLTNQLAYAKKEWERKETVLTQEKAELSKECKALENRMKAMEKASLDRFVRMDDKADREKQIWENVQGQ